MDIFFMKNPEVKRVDRISAYIKLPWSIIDNTNNITNVSVKCQRNYEDDYLDIPVIIKISNSSNIINSLINSNVNISKQLKTKNGYFIMNIDLSEKYNEIKLDDIFHFIVTVSLKSNNNIKRYKKSFSVLEYDINNAKEINFCGWTWTVDEKYNAILK